MNIPVGTVCVVVNGTGNLYEEYMGLECTVVKERRLWDVKDKIDKGVMDGYVVKYATGEVGVTHYKNLQPKRFPGQLQSWLTEKMDKLLAPNPFIVLEEV